MPTERPRVTITVTQEQLKEIEDYRYGNKMKNQTQAILSLVRAGLDELKKREDEELKTASASVDTNAKAVGKDNLTLFRDLLSRAGILNAAQDLSDGDFEFLTAMFLALKAHFKDR